MGKATKLKERARAEVDLAVAKTLSSKHKTSKPDKWAILKAIMGEMTPYMTGLLRPAKDFKPVGYTKESVRLSFIRHLFVKWPVPKFLLAAPCHTFYFDWMKAVGAGQPLFPLAKGHMSRKAVHWYLKAPSTNSPGANITWAKAKAVGLSSHIAQALSVINYSNDKFLEWLSRNPIERVSELSSVIDYLRANNVDLKGRSAKALINLAQDWHEKAEIVASTGELPDYGLGTWEIEEGNKSDKDNFKNYKKWSVFQLTSSEDIVDEGRAMHHCVWSYVNRCKEGQTAIFVLRREEWSESKMTFVTKRAATLEIRRYSTSFSVVQKRKSFNQILSQKENSVVSAWESWAAKKINDVESEAA